MSYRQELMDKTIAHALKNPIQSRGRNTISRMAALITNGDMTFIGLNKYKSHPMMYRFSKDHEKICLHAEIDALTKFFHFYNPMIFQSYSKHSIYIARVLKNGIPALAKPCETCLGALTYFGIREIYYT